jgi:hypothetical protein
MVRYGRSPSCTEAELYYYEYLCGRRDQVIPPAVIEHIRRCTYCRRRIGELESMFGQPEACTDQAPQVSDVVDTLTRHFTHIGRNIGCTDVKPFLPTMLIASQKIVIPTPITVHLDHCLPCAEDLESLRELELRPEQLTRLSELYGADRSEDRAMCRRAGPYISAFASMTFEDIDAEVLNHICTCPQCLRRVCERRDRALLDLRSEGTFPAEIVCDTISTADLFDWVVPHGSAGAQSGQTPADETLPAHLQACPDCMERMQAVHRTVYGVAQRADSGVSTVYSTGQKAQQVAGQPTDLYRSYPIHVGVTGRELQPVEGLGAAARVRAGVRRTVRHPHFKPALRVTAAAAVVLLGFTYFFSTQAVSGVSVRQLSAAVKGVENLHVVRHGSDRIRLVDELWMSRAAGLVVVKNAVEQGVYNLKTGEKTVWRPRERTTERGPLSSRERTGLRDMVDSILGLASLTDVPLNAELQPLPPGAVEGVEEGCEVYDLLWQGRSASGRISHYRMWAYLDSTTQLPRRTETYQQVLQEQEWQLVNVREFEYPTRQAVDLAAEQMLGTR